MKKCSTTSQKSCFNRLINYVNHRFFLNDFVLISLLGVVILSTVAFVTGIQSYYVHRTQIAEVRASINKHSLPVVNHFFDLVLSSAADFNRNLSKDSSLPHINLLLENMLEQLNKTSPVFVGAALVKESGDITLSTPIEHIDHSLLAPLVVASTLSHWSERRDSLQLGDRLSLPSLSLAPSFDVVPVNFALKNVSKSLAGQLVFLFDARRFIRSIPLENSISNETRFMMLNERGKDIMDQVSQSTNLSVPFTHHGYHYSMLIPSSRYPVTILAGVSQQRALPPLFDIIVDKLVLFTPISAAFVLFCAWYRRRIIETVLDLTKAAKQLGNENTDIDLPRKVPNKELFDLTKAFIAIQNAQKNIIHTLLSLASLKEKQDELIRISDRSDRIKLEMLCEIRHRTRDLLKAISMTAQMLLCHLRRESNIRMTPERQEEALIRINTLARHIEAFTADVLENEYFDSSAVVQECVTLQHKTLLKSGINLVYNTQEDLPPIYADKIRFIQSINSLIRRASDFLVGGETITILVEKTAADTRDDLVITITDNGYGIAEEKRQELFEMHNGRGIERDVEGIELSIASVRKILALQGGGIEIVDEWGKGSIITVRIPYSDPNKVCPKVLNHDRKEPLPSNVTLLFKPKEGDDI